MRLALPVLWSALMLLAPLHAAEVYRRLDPPADQRLANAGLEQQDGAALTGWNGYGAGYQAAPGVGREGSTAAVCRRTRPGADGTGIVQNVTLEQQHATPLVVTGWSKAEAVDGNVDGNYSLYCDLTFIDGTNLWGQIAAFPVGTHDWARAQVLIAPAKPVRSIAIYGLFRGHLGTVWFDDFALGELGGAGITMLDGVAVEPVRAASPTDGEEAWSAGPLSVRMTGARVADVTLNGSSCIARAATGGFLVRDVAADSGFHAFDDGQALGVKLATKTTIDAGAIRVEATLSDTGTTDRAVTFMYALPIDAIGWTWNADADTAQPIAEAGSYGSFNRLEAGALGQLSNYPLANLAGPPGGVNLAIDPKRPTVYRLGYSGSARLFYIAFDLALPSGLFGQPASATVAFDIYPSDAAWGFRAALEQFYKLHADLYQVRCPDQGIWMAFAPISKVAGFEDFGFRYKEGDQEPAWDEAHDIQTFRYSEMGTYWLRMPPEMPRTYDNAVKLLQENAARGVPLAKATLTSGMHDRQGRYMMLFKQEPWCDGAVFSLNPSPDLSGDTQAEVAWGAAKKAAYTKPGALLDGEYLDSLEGYVTAALNFREDHLKQASLPLTFTTDDHRPVLHKAFSIDEFVARVANDVHGMGKLLMANGTPYRFGFMTVWFDVMGTETNWFVGGNYSPNSDSIMALRRALAGQKPYLLLQNTDFEPFGPHVEKYFARALAYGMYPSMFSHNAAEDHYFTKPAWYNRDRALFKQYIPQIKAVAEEGWQPITAARCDNPAIHLERFGPGRTKRVFVTVHNPTDQAQSGTVAFESERLGRAVADKAVSLKPYETQVIEL